MSDSPARLASETQDEAMPARTPTRGLSRDDLLYPPLTPRSSGRLELDAVHTMYWEESGNPSGVPVVFLHGGPGGGSSPEHRRYFDPQRYRIVVYDQRGAGQSTPSGELAGNTTPQLVADLERLRWHLDIDRWMLFGGSWGSTLALAYAEAHAQRVTGLVLRGIFLGRPQEVRWFLHDIQWIFPEAWRAFSSQLPVQERGNLLEAYYLRLTDPDPAVHLPAAHAWSRYESSCSTLLPDPELVARFDEDAAALAIARIEAHYFVHEFFLPENALLANIGRIRHLPCTIVQGRYDAVCPIRSADDLHRAWPQADFRIVPGAGHSAREPGIVQELLAATDRFQPER